MFYTVDMASYCPYRSYHLSCSELLMNEDLYCDLPFLNLGNVDLADDDAVQTIAESVA